MVPFQYATYCERVIQQASRAQKCADSGDRIELELRMGSGGEFLLHHLDSVLQCLQCRCDLLAQAPTRSSVRYHDTSDLRCISFGTTAFWERKTVLAFAKLPIVGFGRGAACKLVASRERYEARPHNADIHDKERWRRRYSSAVSGGFRLDLTIVDEYRFTVEYEFVGGRIPPSKDLMNQIQKFMAQWGPAHLLLSELACGLGPDFCLARVTSDLLKDPPTLLTELQRAARTAPQPLSLTRARLAAVIPNPSGWAVSAKLDGVRALVWMDAIYSTTPRALLFLPRLRRTYVLPAPNSTSTLCRKGPLVLDVEVFWNARAMVAFDCLLHEGRALHQDTPYGERFGLAQALANQSGFEWPMQMRCKRLWPLARAEDASRSVAQNDGLIVHELGGEGRTFKWKPQHTIDVRAVDGKSRMCLSDRTPIPAVRPKSFGTTGRGVVWECAWDGEKAIPIKVRTDKTKANTQATFHDIKQAHKDAIQLRELCLG